MSATHNLNPGDKKWKLYAHNIIAREGTDDLILEVSANKQIIFKEGNISYYLADLSNTELLSATPGTATASKALILDSNKDIGTIRNLTIDGVFTDGNYTFDTNGNVSGLGTVGCGAITSSGNLAVTGTITADTSITLDSTTITTAEIGVLDSVTAGIAAASKALVLDSNKDISGIRIIKTEGAIEAGKNTNTTSYFGTAAIGNGGRNNAATFAHLDNNTLSSFSLKQSTAGTTTINASQGQNIEFKIANTYKMILTSTGLGIGLSSSVNHLLEVNGDVSCNGLYSSSTITAIGAITGGSFVIGSANISESELETIDGITAGTASASKALVVDSNVDIAGLRNITATGDISANDASFTSVNISENLKVSGAIKANGYDYSYSVISGNSNSDLDGFISIQNKLSIRAWAFGVVTSNGNNGYYPDIYGTESKDTDISTNVQRSVGIIDTNVFQLKKGSVAMGGTNSINGGNTGNVPTGEYARWGIQLKQGGVYRVKYVVAFENEWFNTRLTVKSTPCLTVKQSSSPQTEYEIRLLGGEGHEYSRNDQYGQYGTQTGECVFCIPNAVAEISSGAWLRIHLHGGKGTTEEQNNDVTGLKVRTMSIEMDRLGDAI